MTIWEYWNHLKAVLSARDYTVHSQLFDLYERPSATMLWWLWPWLHIALVGFLLFYIIKIGGIGRTYEKYEGVRAPDVGILAAWALGFGLYLAAGTAAGYQHQMFVGFQRAYAAVIPARLPDPPPPYQPSGRILTQDDLLPDRRDTRYWLPQYRATQIMELRTASRSLLTALDFFILLTPVGVIFVFFFIAHWRYFIFARAYSRAVSTPHLPTEIVDRALAGQSLDHRALARAMTPSTAPITTDTIADKIERERLTRLADRLRSDGAALDQKLARETEIARLVVDHARKREELSDMERKLRGMGVRR